MFIEWLLMVCLFSIHNNQAQYVLKFHHFVDGLDEDDDYLDDEYIEEEARVSFMMRIILIPVLL
mgnify:FL=1